MYTRLRQRQFNMCPICGYPLPLKDGDCHADHIVPCARGGTFEESNLQLTHPMCNLLKGDLPGLKLGVLQSPSLFE